MHIKHIERIRAWLKERVLLGKTDQCEQCPDEAMISVCVRGFKADHSAMDGH